ncbi:sugar ABC transporter substrate-binding protein [Bacillus altitudinis]|uniref:sugar ABC transporter substrate-binding protein n=1 Tax=Bacillus altitudinis TaxID=293387 RepID=UPI0024C111D8|nr:sugar ABC transporter substrate-binding protein [Bacillus altitudinis]MEE3604446.1 sugar ABC transporter substrate-binding protein [Bacillus altitudinis]MEE3610026.1 sugar ABC transporter substrate-binding protein [Bacillus altitudinis]MEE3646185.1 sugar ABC transporter substrate-binding protein [Bacillus altitudinis]MEE4390608.1 sugar ABC transporter substrate-binding protein [Bacillus altitudinis]MEE4393776.1 sugar ABC transporter substrate-binding protein [Bacillus altitudinis]
MKRKYWTSSLVLLTVLTVLLSGCGTGSSAGSKANANEKVYFDNVPKRFAKGQGAKIKVIRKIGGDDHTAQFLAGTKAEGEALGFTVDVYTANGDTAKFHDAISQALEENYDGFIISHGDDEATVADVKKITAKGIPVVAFDSNPKLKDIKGVTVTSQDDEQLAKKSLDALVADFKGKANIAYLWVDGFPPMVRRNKVYQETLKQHTGIKELDRFGVAASDTSVQTQNAVAAMLNKYPKGKLDAIFATWDAFAIGAARALKEAGRTEVKIYGIDVSNADLQEMTAKDSPWKYTAAVDPKLIGAIDVRILAKKLAGEKTPSSYDLEASLISQKQLQDAGKALNMVNLADEVKGFGSSTAFEEDWMKTLKKHYAK